MKILIVGSGAREQAIASALARSARAPVLCVAGNSYHPVLMKMAEHYWVGDLCDVAAIVRQACAWQVELAIIGPEAPLEAGLADALCEKGIPVAGPRKALAQIETSKAFARDLMRENHIPGQPDYRVFHDMTGVAGFLAQLGEHGYVIKADGLCGGKGVKVAGEHLHSFAEALNFCEKLVCQGKSFVIEAKCIGQEFSLMGFCDGERILFMPPVQDHKRAFVGDRGPNTGGMGSYSCENHTLPFLTAEDLATAREIATAVFHALQKKCQQPYIGILYGSFMATAEGVCVIEFNARFGDPEALNVLSILNTDFLAICEAMVSHSLTAGLVSFAHRATVCKYAVPEGYPDNPVRNGEIRVDSTDSPARLYFAAVDEREGKLYATGSRTAAAVGIADSVAEAGQIAESGISLIQGQLFHRQDIGTASVLQERILMMQSLRGVYA